MNLNERPPIFTIGYGAREITAFIEILFKYQIKYLIDVRSRPYSRFKPEFSQTSLRASLAKNNIRYVYMGGSLGGQPDDESCYIDGKVDYQIYQTMPIYRAGIERLHTAWTQYRRVAIMCSEGKPQECHRSKLIGRSLVEEGIDVRHIDEQGNLITQEEVLLTLTGGQKSLLGFDPRVDQSRKKYREQEDE